MSETRLPRHVAVIMDGNGRWARKRFMPRTAGHRAAVNRVKDLVSCSGELQIEALTLYAFSSENWRRPKNEVSTIMQLMLRALHAQINELHANNVQVKFIGDRDNIPADLHAAMTAAENKTAANQGLKLTVALNYGSHNEILQAVKAIGTDMVAGKLKPDQVDGQLFEQYLQTSNLPSVDLFIRTSGEQRISNYMLWQLAYAELYFTPTLFPDFNRTEYLKALEWYATRERRFGGVTPCLDKDQEQLS